MSNVPSIASSHSAAREAVPETPAVKTKPLVNESLRDRFDPGTRLAEATIIDAPNPTVVRYLTSETRRRRDNDAKSAFKQLWFSLKPKAKARRSMEKAMRSEVAVKDELRTINKFIDNAWARAQECFRVGDAAGVRVHWRQVSDLSRQAERLKTDLKSVQDLETVLVDQLSSSRLMNAHETAMRAIKNTPDTNKALQDRLEALEAVKDRAAESDDLLRGNLEVAADDEDAEMRMFMEKLAQNTQVGLETAPPVANPPKPVRNNEQWQPIYE